MAGCARLRLVCAMWPAVRPFGANLAYGSVDDALQLVRVGIGVALLNVLNGAIKHAPPDGLFNEFREVALFCSLGTQKGAQGEVGLFRDFDVPANGIFLHGGT